VTKVVLTHAVEDVDRWLSFKAERAASIGALGGSNAVDHVSSDGNDVAISFETDDLGGFEAGMATPSEGLSDAMQRHGVIPPVIAYVEK
jgi:hypothetical protein